MSVGCGAPAGPSSTAATPAATPVAVEPPGLGELMTFNQMRHAKLWFAGEAGNWKLAQYEVDELGEGFDDVVRYHPTHKDSPVPIGASVEKIIREPIAEVGRAVAAGDRARFEKAFDALTDGCNRCHQATNFGFNVVQRPTANAFSNQSFAPPASSGTRGPDAR
ncbi:MAG TPA: hypothetical protein VFA98_14645 [Thermoanaerobaculia bacterium]|nr:hypothetical protein [Thermoanaerobaculia bacterium]